MGLWRFGHWLNISLWIDMKIAILSFYSGNVERGVENWTFELGNRLTKKHEVTVFQAKEERKKVKYTVITPHIFVNWDNISTTNSALRRFFLDYWSVQIAKFTLKVLPELWKQKYDIVIPTNGGWQVAFIRILTWLRGAKMVVVGHAGLGWDDRNNLWSFPDRFVALSKRAENWAKKVTPFVKTVVIPNGVDLDEFTPKGSVAKLDLPKPIILAVSAFEPGKRLDLTIRAVAGLKKGSLLFIGSGIDEKDLRVLGYQLLGKKRFQLMHVEYKDISKYYRAADIFTLPSWGNEAFGMVYLEAMACGLPVVATDDELRREIVGEAGVLVDPTDTSSYTKALEKALEKKWGYIPRKQAEKFGWEYIVLQYEKLFNELISR